MPYTLEQFSADVYSKLKADPGVHGQHAVLEFVTKALLDGRLAPSVDDVVELAERRQSINAASSVCS